MIQKTLFLYHKKPPAGSTLRRKRQKPHMRPPQAQESRKRDSLFLYRKVRLLPNSEMKIARTKAGKENRRFQFRRYKNLLRRNRHHPDHQIRVRNNPYPEDQMCIRDRSVIVQRNMRLRFSKQWKLRETSIQIEINIVNGSRKL